MFLLTVYAHLLHPALAASPARTASFGDAQVVLTGERLRDGFGLSLDAAGDVNGDGYDDLIVGAPDNDLTGKAYLYLGSADGLSDAPAWTSTGSDSGVGWGVDVAGAGDLNGDGFDDLIIGTDTSDVFIAGAYIYFGSADGPVAGPRLSGTSTDREYGTRVEGVGDLNGDGYDDVAVQVFTYIANRSEVELYGGGPTGIEIGPVRIDAPASMTYFGQALAGAGDVNADGYDDLLIGREGGYYQLVAGHRGLKLVDVAPLFEDKVVEDGYGSTLDGVGDLDGDGVEDYIFGSLQTTSGSVHVNLGSASRLDAESELLIEGGSDSANFGAAMSGAGDIDADGHGDFIVGSPGFGGDAGRALVYFGSPDIVDLEPAVLEAPEGCVRFGQAVVGAGDVNGDGYPDFVVSCDEDSRGVIRVYLGYADADADGTHATEDCDDADPSAYPGAEEVEGDGIDQDCDGADAEATGDDPTGDGAGGGGGGGKGGGCCQTGGPASAALWAIGLGLGLAGARRRPSGEARRQLGG